MSLPGKALHLWRAHASCPVFAAFLRSQLVGRRLRRRHAAVAAELREFAQREGFRRDWFSANVPVWMDIFERTGLRGRPVRALEIGSFEGLSACFLLQQLPQARLTCVDTWEGSDEHAGLDVIRTIEQAFDRHVAPWAGRVEKHRGTSASYFASPGRKDPYDFIYVDGSHHGDDVMADALSAFALLKVGGVMVFDDYLWAYYPRFAENPAVAVNGFLRLVAGRHRLIHVGYQLALVKTAERSHSDA